MISSQASHAGRTGTSVLLVSHSSADKRVSVETLPPLGILGIAACLEEKGVKTDVIDFSVEPRAVIRPQDYGAIGFSVNIANREASLREIDRIRRLFPSVHVVVGGPLCLCDPAVFTSNPSIDAVFACEGEEALFEYLTAPDRTKTKGVYVRAGSQVTFAGPREPIRDLDRLPFPALDKVPIGRYNNYPKRRRPIASIMTSRGCPYGCIFCSHAMGRKWRAQSAARVVEEIRWLVTDLGVREICIYDDNFSLDRERAVAICDGIIDAKIQVALQFSNGLRADNLDRPLLEEVEGGGHVAHRPRPGGGGSRGAEENRERIRSPEGA